MGVRGLPGWNPLLRLAWAQEGRGGHGCVACVLVMGLWGSAADGGGMQGRAGRQWWALAGLPKLG